MASIEKYFKARTGVDTPDLLTSSATVYDYFQTPVVKFDTASSTNIDYLVPGHIFWNYEEGTLDLSMNGEILQTIGMQAFMPPTKNDSGETINRGDYVMATGVQGDRLTIAKAINDGSVSPDYFIGVAANSILDGSENGLILTNGLVKEINTASWTVGTILYPDPETAGKLTSTKPDPPSMRTPVAIVIRQQANSGRILVRNSTGSTLGQSDSNVLFTNVSNNDLIIYNGSASYWSNQNIITAIQSVDGAGSGLDADLLDGQHGSYYATDSGVVHLAGTETITGAKTFSSNLTMSASDILMGNTLGDRITLYGTHDASSAYAIGIESSTMYFKSGNSFFRWYIATNANNGTSDVMELSSSGLSINGSLTATSGSFSGTLSSGQLSLNRNNTSSEGGEIAFKRAVDNATAFTLDIYGNDTSPSMRLFNAAANKVWYFTSDGNTTFPGSISAVTKSFDIEHPTKENMRLRYGSLEGPENGVYVRGKSSSSTITLPDYWTGLVDENSITVQLTAKGKAQGLYVVDIIDNTVEIGGVEGEFFYFIQAERKDIGKLVVEYGS